RQSAGGLLLPPALSVRRRPVPDRDAGAPGDRARARRALPPGRRARARRRRRRAKERPMSKRPAALTTAAILIAAGIGRARGPPFYEGRTIGLVVGFAPGGGFVPARAASRRSTSGWPPRLRSSSAAWRPAARRTPTPGSSRRRWDCRSSSSPATRAP